MFGILDQHKEISLTAKSVNRIPWHYGRYFSNGAKTTGRKVEKDPCRGRSVFEGGVNHSKGSFSSARQDECSHTGDTSSSSLLSPFTNEFVSGARLLLPELRDKYNIVSGWQRGTELVDYQHEQMEWQNTIKERNRYDNRIRCVVSHRMGSGMLSSEDRRSMVSDGKDDAYKLFGVAGSNSSSSNICKKPQQNIFATASRQHHSSGIHQQLGWDDFQAVSWSSKGPMDVVSGEKNPHHSTTPTWEVELPCRHRKSSGDGSLGLEIESNDISEDRSTVWSTRSGPVCLQTDNPTTDIFSWRPDPYAVATDSFLQDWTTRKGYANPPWCMIHVGRTLSQVKSQLAQIVLVTPVWKPQPWYPVLLNMVIDYLRLILDNPVVVNQHHPGMFPQLAVWLISGRDILAKNFRRMLQIKNDSLFGRWSSWCSEGVPIPFLDL